MGMTMTQKILAKHAGVPAVKAGDLITCSLDRVLANDITAPPAIAVFKKIGKPVFDREKIALIPDHFTPNKDIKSAGLAKIVRDFAREHQIKYYYEVGRVGIEHVLLPEQGIVAPGMMTIGADSHTCTYGALGGFATGVGSTDLGVAMATGKAWFKVPDAIRVYLTGEKPADITGKDVMLTLIGMIGVDGALYQSLEFQGPGVASLDMTDRFTIANMAIEAGAKNGIFPVDEQTRAYEKGRVSDDYAVYKADDDAPYARTVEIDLSKLKPVVAFPHLPGNTKVIGTFGDIPIDQVVIGSCTNGRLEDLAIAAKIFEGHSVHPSVRCIVIPGSQQVYRDAMKAGYIDTFIAAGCAVSTPTCGPCLGGYMGILAAGERCVSTTNRNFRGRMGHVDSEVYLAGPQVAAASAILGKIATPKEVK
ncbi:MAG: 3-isopropylmalate dehydratase large subunit [Selenomonadaceae bacterium]|nr:3-isopropylmalate dehydratase large subunit [Selenomonadaceae bacterium]MDY2685772.1 3-isopropylmalate dehydratase large subunit [Selenomonadaceae bacterium]